MCTQIFNHLSNFGWRNVTGVAKAAATGPAEQLLFHCHAFGLDSCEAAPGPGGWVQQVVVVVVAATVALIALVATTLDDEEQSHHVLYVFLLLTTQLATMTRLLRPRAR